MHAFLHYEPGNNLRQQLTIQLFPSPLHPSRRIPSMSQSCTFRSKNDSLYGNIHTCLYHPALTKTFPPTKKSKNCLLLQKKSPWFRGRARASWKTIWHFSQKLEQTPQKSSLCLHFWKAHYCQTLDQRCRMLFSSLGLTGFQ